MLDDRCKSYQQKILRENQNYLSPTVSSKLSASHGSMNVKLDFQLKSRQDGESRKVWSLLFMFSLNNKIKIPKNSSKEKLI